MRNTLQIVVTASFISILIVANLIFVIGAPFVKVLRHSLVSQKKTLSLILKNEKTTDDLTYIQKSLATAQLQTYRLAVIVRKLSTILPMESVVEATDALSTASLQLPQLLGADNESNIVILFLNNYELRPGGGFIGSLGFVTLKNYTIANFEVQDVYEIDGQITTHHEPHFAVRKYLQQPNEFLRDSNFSPDFAKSSKKALQYLSDVQAYKKQYVMVIGVTATMFEELLELTGPIELTDFNTTITSSNFFTTTQRKIENTFFAGSRQKRSILQSLGNIMRQRVEELPLLDAAEYIFNSVNTKNLVFYAPDKQLQNLFIAINAAGSQVSSYQNWIMPVDANVGVNKMDALIRKTMELTIVDSEQSLTHSFKSTYTNTITADALEQESYKNYFQLYVPKGAVLKKALINNLDVSGDLVTTEEGQNTVFAIYFVTPPASTTTISITYDLPKNIGMRQLQFQKQIGSKFSPLTVIYKGKATRVQQMLLKSDEVFTLP